MRSEQFRPRSIRQESIERGVRGYSANFINTSSATDTLKTQYDIIATCATTSNIALDSTTTTVDGVRLESPMTVLVWQQTDYSENGVYGHNNGVWTKLDILKPSVFVRVQRGLDFADAVFVLAVPDLSGTIDTTTDVVFKRIDGMNAVSEAVGQANGEMNAVIAEFYDKILCLIDERTPIYIVCKYAGLPSSGMYETFGGAPATYHAIPFENVVYEPSEGTVTKGSDGGFYYTPARAGYYHVDVYYKDDVTTPVGNVWLSLNNGVEMDRIDLASQKLRLQGSQIVYCAPPYFISAGLTHDAVGMMYFNNAALDLHGAGYINIHFCGDLSSATIA